MVINDLFIQSNGIVLLLEIEVKIEKYNGKEKVGSLFKL
jgi:hypothetical protein